jgi:hypothetical protein
MRLVPAIAIAVLCPLFLAGTLSQSFAAPEPPAPATTPAAPLTDKQIADLVDTACSATADDAARKVAVEKLKDVGPFAMTAPLVRRIKDEATAELAIDFASARGVPGLFAVVKPSFDKAAREERVTNIAVRSGDAVAARFIVARWLKAAEGTSTYNWTLVGLSTVYMDMAACDELMRVVADTKSERRVRAAELVKFQAMAHTADPEALIKEWRTLKTEFIRASQGVAPLGTNLFNLNWVTAQNLRHSGPNIIVEKGSLTLTKFPPNGPKEVNYIMRSGFLILTPGKVVVTAVAAGGKHAHIIVIEKGKCSHPGDTINPPVDIKEEAWVELVSNISGWRSADGSETQVMVTTCNGKSVGINPDDMAGLPVSLTLQCEGRIAVLSPGFSWKK